MKDVLDIIIRSSTYPHLEDRLRYIYLKWDKSVNSEAPHDTSFIRKHPDKQRRLTPQVLTDMAQQPNMLSTPLHFFCYGHISLISALAAMNNGLYYSIMYASDLTPVLDNKGRAIGQCMDVDRLSVIITAGCYLQDLTVMCYNLI